MKIAHFDPSTGAAGDMIVGALIDAGAKLEEVRRQLTTLPLPEFVFEAEEIRTHGFRALRMRIEVPDESSHRHLPKIEEILDSGKLSERVVATAKKVFRQLAKAEAESHGIDEDKVHFHEVGALDAIVDIAGAAIALELLGVESLTFSPLHVGTGETKSAHGVLSVPVPAVLALTRDVPIVRTAIRGEILTPTGAAILTALGRPAGSEPFVSESNGAACGTKELEDRANILRVSIGHVAVRPAAEAATADRDRGDREHLPWECDDVSVLETNLDDMSPEAIPSVLEDVLRAGALDAYVTPVLMKKGRPGHLLTVLVTPDLAERAAEILFRSTTTFGIRRSTCSRWKLVRESREITSPWGPIRVKVGNLGGGKARITPEYESCREIAERERMPLIEVYREAEELIRSVEWVVPGE